MAWTPLSAFSGAKERYRQQRWLFRLSSFCGFPLAERRTIVIPFEVYGDELDLSAGVLYEARKLPLPRQQKAGLPVDECVPAFAGRCRPTRA